MNERSLFVLDSDSGLFSMSESSERFGISRPTCYKQWARYRTEGLQALQIRSRKRRHSRQIASQRGPEQRMRQLSLARIKKEKRGSGLANRLNEARRTHARNRKDRLCFLHGYQHQEVNDVPPAKP